MSDMDVNSLFYKNGWEAGRKDADAEIERLRERIEELDQAGNRIGKKLDAARRRIEELEKITNNAIGLPFEEDDAVLYGRIDVCERVANECHIITRDQIRAAWDRIAAVNKCNDQWCMYRSEANRWGRDILEDIGIVRCETCNLDPKSHIINPNMPCPTCHGDGWVIASDAINEKRSTEDG